MKSLCDPDHILLHCVSSQNSCYFDSAIEFDEMYALVAWNQYAEILLR